MSDAQNQNSIIEKKIDFFKTKIDFWEKTKLTSLTAALAKYVYIENVIFGDPVYHIWYTRGAATVPTVAIPTSCDPTQIALIASHTYVYHVRSYCLFSWSIRSPNWLQVRIRATQFNRQIVVRFYIHAILYSRICNIFVVTRGAVGYQQSLSYYIDVVRGCTVDKIIYSVSQKNPPLRTCGNISETAWNFSTKFCMPIMHSYLR